MKSSRMLVLALSGVSLVALARNNESRVGGTVVSSGVPNPAAVTCVDKLGGQYIVVSAADGNQSGLCKIDGATINGWTLYRALNDAELPMAAKVFMEHPSVEWPHCPPGAACVAMPNPSAYYCSEVGGTMNYFDDRAGERYDMCSFPDNSSIDAWTLFAGPGSHPTLARILTK